MALNISPGHVLCPSCTGSGTRPMSIADPPPGCTLCDGVGEVTEQLAEEFWECVRTAAAKENNTVGVLSTCVNHWPPRPWEIPETPPAPGLWGLPWQ